MVLGGGFGDADGGGDGGDGVVPPFDGVTSSALLTVLAGEEQARHASEVRTWQGIVAWAERNLWSDDEAGTERHVDDVVAAFDTGTRVAGDGTPLVAEFALMELIAVLGRTPDGGRDYVARILECAWRLRRVYAAVISGRLAPWRAARIADHTLNLNAAAAVFVDAQLFHAHRVSWAQVDRLIAEAVVRFDPEAAEAERRKAQGAQHVTFSEVSAQGQVYLDATLDAADGTDLKAAVTRGAEVRRRFGDEAPLDERRARALGDIARRDLELDLLIADPDTGEVIATSPGRVVETVVHLTPDSFTGENPVARWNNRPIATAQVKEWIGEATTLIIRPVIDLENCDHVDAYEVPDRLRKQVVWRDHACRFPGCGVPAERCDLDHRHPHNQGGATCPCNLTPLCRKHHRAKTHGRWHYVLRDPGTHRWTSPTGRVFLVTPHGTHPQRE